MKTKQTGKNKKSAKSASAHLTEVRSLSTAWPPFIEKLAEILEGLKEDQYLVITKKNSNEFVQFSCQGAWGVRAETTSNFYRGESNQLNDSQALSLANMGWLPPTYDPEKSSNFDDPDGSSNHYIEFTPPISFSGVAGMAVWTFVEIMKISHPGFLQYQAFDNATGNSIPLPQLGLKLAIDSDEAEQNSELPQLLLATVIELTGIDDWTYDDDGDLGGIRYGSCVAYARCLEDRPYIRFYSILLRGVKPTLPLLLRLNQINADHGHLHLVMKNDVVMAISDVLVTPFISSMIAHGLGNFCQIVDGYCNQLEAEFGEDSTSIKPPTQVVH